jgi:hypothetical protein
MANRKVKSAGPKGSKSKFARAIHSSQANRQKRTVKWDESMKLGLVGLVSAFAFKMFSDTYIEGKVTSTSSALYLGIVFGIVVMLVWKFWPWRE